jgi:hypothetical protein
MSEDKKLDEINKAIVLSGEPGYDPVKLSKKEKIKEVIAKIDEILEKIDKQERILDYQQLLKIPIPFSSKELMEIEISFKTKTMIIGIKKAKNP